MDDNEWLFDTTSDLSALLWMSALLRTNRPCSPQFGSFEAYRALSQAITFPHSEYTINNDWQILAVEERQGINQVPELHILRLRPVGQLLQTLCETTPWPAGEDRTVSWLVASTKARASLLRFWEAMRDILKGDIRQENPDKTNPELENTWEHRMASFFHSREIRQEYEAEMNGIIDRQQQNAASLAAKARAERMRIESLGNRYNQEWKRKNDPTSTVVQRGKKVAKKPDPPRPQQLKAETKVFVDFLHEFTQYFEQEMPPAAAPAPAPAPPPRARIALNPANFMVFTWLFPDQSGKDKIPGRVRWIDFQRAMAAAGFPSRCVDGSKYAFTGVDVNGVNRRIVLHNPCHGQGTDMAMKPQKLKACGKRLVWVSKVVDVLLEAC